MEIFLVSALAKLGATVCTYPLLLIKQRLQSAGKHTHKDRQYSGTTDAVRRIWKTEGTVLLMIIPLAPDWPDIVMRAALPNPAPTHTHKAGELVPDARKFCFAGFLGFYNGMNTKIVQSILAAALMMAIKEKLTAGTRAVLETPRASPHVLQQQAKALVTGVK